MNRQEYYSNVEVLFEIIKNLVGRETVFLGGEKAIRCIKAHTINYLMQNFKAFNFLNHPYNLYYSLAHYQNMPMFSFNLKKRKQDQIEFNQHREKYISGFDYALDFDSHQYNPETKQIENLPLKTLLQDVSKVKDLFDDSQIPYSLRLSGSGFHINIDSIYLPKKETLKKQMEYFLHLTDRFKTILNCPSIDSKKDVNGNIVGIMDISRIWKCPYSYDVKTGNIALPLTDEDFVNFTWDIVKPEYVISQGVKNRGILTRPGNTSKVSKLFDEFSGEKYEI